MANEGKILVIGSSGQIGTELIEALRLTYGREQVIASDIKQQAADTTASGPFEVLDVLDSQRLGELVQKHSVRQIYLLAALLSATAEQKIKSAWRLNMDGLLNVLELAREKKIQLFWPSSIAVFGPGTPRENTPQNCFMDPSTVYGISKLAGERWCEYYFLKFGVDVRSLRYPGLIGYKSTPGGGTTDYAVDIFHQAIQKGSYSCFLGEDTVLPMMYMPDALRATISLMQAPAGSLKVRSSYNVAGMSFSPAEISREIQKLLPGFSCQYAPDYRQQIAESWPKTIDDSVAQAQWGWKPAYDLGGMCADMIQNLSPVHR